MLVIDHSGLGAAYLRSHPDVPQSHDDGEDCGYCGARTLKGNGIRVVPMSISDAREYVRREHRHHEPPVGGLFAIGCAEGDRVVGCVIVGRPVARGSDDGWTAEVTRLASDGTRNVCSLLYRAAWRACRAMGYRRLITYTLTTEPGTSLRAAGMRLVGERGGGSWSTPSRPRVDRHPLQTKLLWELTA